MNGEMFPQSLSLVEQETRHLPLEIRSKVAQEYLKKSYRESLFATCKYLLSYKDMTWQTHGDMVRALEGPSTRKLIVMPRGTFKSSISTIGYPIWLLNRNPNLRILLDSEVYTNSKNFLREIKGHLVCTELTNVFGEYMSNNWTEGEITIKQRTSVLKEASITCGGVGTVKVGQHYDVIISDDLNSNKNSATPEGCQKVIDHYRMNTAILEPGGIYVIVGTRYSAQDLIQHVLDNEIMIQ
jgi:hypothetical protein